MPKAALYVRLSREDRDKVDKSLESESIINQQIMLLEYCKKQGWDVFRIYNDEDYSGSDRDRPEFNKLLKDARDRKFDIVLSKTQSRFARDMEIVEKYINTLFPIWGIRFVGLVDNADSDNKSNRKSRQINSMVDQWMLEDLSENIKATLSAKRKSGLWVGAFAPFGYIKDPDNKNHLIPDPEAAEIVKYIFKLYLKGYGVNSLTRKLNEEGIPNPAAYKKSKGQAFQNKNRECSTLWGTFSIQRLLKNQVYLGHTVQGQTENISYKSNKKRSKPKEEWDIVKNTHEPIIDEYTFYKVQETLNQKRRSDKTGAASIFANKIKCLRCGGSMRSQISGKKKYYVCHRHFVAPDLCEGTYVSKSVVEKTVLSELRKLYNAYIDEETVEKSLSVTNKLNEKINFLSKQIDNIKNEYSKVENRFKHLYYDKLDGIISPEDYNILYKDCKDRQLKLQNQLSILSEKISVAEEQKKHSSNIKDIISQFKNITELDRYTVETLIDYIEVGGNKNDRIIKIHWNF